MQIPGKWRWIAAAAVVAAGVGLAGPDGPAVAAPIAGTATAIVPQADDWHGLPGGSIIDYWTTTGDGKPVQASGALFLPAGPAPAGGWPIAAYDHGTSGMGQNCGGITTVRRGQGLQDTFLQRLLAQGFAVVAPDYLGLGRFDTGPHPYLELRTEATATIDLLRAARSTHPELSRTWMVFGGSQGGQAALGTAHLQQSTAPDLDFRGVVAIDPESDVEKLLTVLGPDIPDIPDIPMVSGPATALVAMMLEGIRSSHPEAGLDDYLTPHGRAVLDSIGGLCLGQIGARTAGLQPRDLFARPLRDARIAATITSYMAVPTTDYRQPVLLFLNVTDPVVPSPLHALLAAELTAGQVNFRVVPGTGEHTQMNPQMWAALDDFLTTVRTTPATA
ncbi:lipase family protein [Nocardia sp. alder85J]|uniref:lipase family protein n=1 Tax=Nocardia sp. alder85J TaxID=2862949 RepID=UPI001CD6EDA6|nr:lipase family protein [Nocardia sp. alder85J]MCX4097163.1 alpha/beta fold hydrolase [Nocardia sp. alder85J]